MHVSYVDTCSVLHVVYYTGLFVVVLDVIEKDSDTECQKQAAQALLILQEKGKKVSA